MALRSAPIPEWTNDAVRSVIASHSGLFADAPQIAVDHGELSTERIKIGLPVFTTRVPGRSDSRQSAIAKSKSWFKPRRIAWRFLLETKRGVNVGVELHSSQKKDAYHQLHYGPFIQQTSDSIERAMRSKHVKGQDFSLAILQIPALYFSSLWLTKNRGRELYVPLVSFPGQLKIGRFYTRKEVVAALVDKFLQRRKAHERLGVLKAKSSLSRTKQTRKHKSGR